MPYPDSPFDASFNVNVLFSAQNEFVNPCVREIQTAHFQNLNKWLCESPNITSFRVNTITQSVEEIFIIIAERVRELSINTSRSTPEVFIHPILKEVIVVHNWRKNELDLSASPKEIIVDVSCATAVIRGANIFAPGILGMLSGTQIGEEVSIYADIDKACKKGLQKLYENTKIFVGNGIVKMDRSDLFGEKRKNSGIAVELTNSISGSLPLGDFLPKGAALLQNIPSVICVHVLNPCPGETVLDMCASPGNKTTHIAAMMNNTGTLIAIDRSPNKVKSLKENCDQLGASARIFQADSTKIVQETALGDVINGPPFLPESFDKILLDAPCSALGKRPQLANYSTVKMLNSYVPLQRKLFENAVQLLKVNGRLVYSTCTITIGENEGIVSWALKRFSNLQLIKADPHLGMSPKGLSDLSDAQQGNVQRFGPSGDVDSVGFFIAAFIKTRN